MVYVFLASGFEEIEALATVDILRRANIEVQTVGVGGKNITGTHSITVQTDITEAETKTDNLLGVVLPGGLPGAWNLRDSKRVRELTDYCFSKGLLVSAICAAPAVLGRWGMLRNKNAVCYPGFEEQLIGAKYNDFSVVRDGSIITGKGAGAVFEFAFEIVSYLTSSNEKSKKIGDAMQCNH